jgi:hypothetical protein
MDGVKDCMNLDGGKDHSWSGGFGVTWLQNIATFVLVAYRAQQDMITQRQEIHRVFALFPHHPCITRETELHPPNLSALFRKHPY